MVLLGVGGAELREQHPDDYVKRLVCNANLENLISVEKFVKCNLKLEILINRGVVEILCQAVKTKFALNDSDDRFIRCARTALVGYQKLPILSAKKNSTTPRLFKVIQVGE